MIVWKIGNKKHKNKNIEGPFTSYYYWFFFCQTVQCLDIHPLVWISGEFWIETPTIAYLNVSINWYIFIWTYYCSYYLFSLLGNYAQFFHSQIKWKWNKCGIITHKIVNEVRPIMHTLRTAADLFNKRGNICTNTHKLSLPTTQLHPKNFSKILTLSFSLTLYWCNPLTCVVVFLILMLLPSNSPLFIEVMNRESWKSIHSFPTKSHALIVWNLYHVFVFKLLVCQLLAYAPKGYNTIWLLNGKMQHAFIAKGK